MLGIDCGLTLTKVCVFTSKGEKLREVSRETPLKQGLIDTSALLKGVFECTRDAAEGYDICAIGLSGHGNGLYALDRKLSPLIALPSMGSSDNVFLRDPDKYYSLTRQSCWAGQPLQLLRTLKEKQPDLYDQIKTVLHCKDYVRFALTDVLGTDYTDASASALLSIENGRYNNELFDLAGLDKDSSILPGLYNSYDIVGTISQEAAKLSGLKAGIPVAAGMIDLNACMAGTGALSDDIYSVTAGTWGISTRMSDKIIDSHSITQNTYCIDKFHRMAVISSPTSCVNLNWFLNEYMPGCDYNTANGIAGHYSPTECNVIYLPYLYTDMARPGIQSGFFGDTQETGTDMKLRAVYEGVMFAHKDQIERLKKSGLFASKIRLSGGAANSLFWKQLFADGLGLPIETTIEKQAGALGAAMSAAISCGIYKDMNAAVSKMVQVDQCVTPVNMGAYDNKFRKFIELVGEV